MRFSDFYWSGFCAGEMKKIKSGI